MQFRLVTLLVLWATHVTNAALPLSRLFMKRGKPRRKEIGSGGAAVAGNNDNAAVAAQDACVSPKELYKVQDALADTEQARNRALEETTRAQQQATEYKQKLEQHTSETQTRLNQLEQAAASAHKVSQAQEDFAKRIEVAQTVAEKELALAKETIADKEKQIKELSREYELKMEELKRSAETSSEDAQALIRADMETAEASSRERIQKIQSELEEKLKEATQESAILTGEKRALASSFEKLESKYEHMLKDQEEALALYMKENLDIEVARVSGELTDKLSSELIDLKSKTERAIAKLTSDLTESQTKLLSSENSLTNLVAEHADLKVLSEKNDVAAKELLQRTIDDLSHSSKSSLSKITEESERLLSERTAKSEQDVADIKAESERKLSELQEQHKVDFEKMVSRLTSNAEQQEKLLMEKLTSAQSKEKSLLKENERLATEKSKMEDLYSTALEDAKIWEELYDERSYFNLTQITTDAAVYAAQTHKATSESITRAASAATEPVVMKSKQLYDDHVVPAAKKSMEVYESHVVPSAVKSRELFDVHVQPHVNVAAKTAHPIYHKYMHPYVNQAKLIVSDVMFKVDLILSALFADIVEIFQTICPSALSTLSSIETDIGVKLPPSLIDNTRYSCVNGEESVMAFLKFAAIVVAIVFRRPIWNLVWGIVSMIVAVAWSISPIRIIFFRKRGTLENSGRAKQVRLSEKNGKKKMKQPKNEKASE